MKIALVHPSFRRIGGAEAMTLAWMEHLVARGHEVILHTLHPPERGLPCGHVNPLRPGSVARRINHRSWKIASVGRDLSRSLGGTDRVVALNYPALRWVDGALPRAGSPPPVVWYCNEPSRRLYRAVTDRHVLAARARAGFGAHVERRAAELREKERWHLRVERRRDAAAVRRTDALATLSRYAAGLVHAIYGRAAVVLPWGVEVPDEVSAEPREPMLLAVSALDATKNVHAAVEVFCRLAPDWPRLRLVCVGEGGQRAALETRLARAGLARRASLPGRLTPEDLRDAYRRAFAVLYPSLDEPLGLVPLEAMACATPVLASDHGGPAETVVDGQTGHLADPLRPEVWAELLARLLAEPERARRMGEAGRRRVLTHYAAADRLDHLSRFVEEAACASPST